MLFDQLLLWLFEVLEFRNAMNEASRPPHELKQPLSASSKHQ